MEDVQESAPEDNRLIEEQSAGRNFNSYSIGRRRALGSRQRQLGRLLDVETAYEASCRKWPEEMDRRKTPGMTD